MAIEILWFVDRFGIKGNYAATWLRAVSKAGIRPASIKLVNLHGELRGQLLTRHGTRKAPTWRPEREAEIRLCINNHIQRHRSTLKAVVLSSPESLVITGVLPEYATLAKLRGGVYDVAGLPALVILPMSAWFTQISQRDIALANYGANNAEQLETLYDKSNAMGAGNDRSDVADDDGTSDSDDGCDDGADADEHGRSVSGVVPDAHRGGGSGADGDSGEDGEIGSDSGAGALSDSDADEAESDDTEDTFYYVPVMTPVGKLMIEFDLGKLSRITSGKTHTFWGPIK